MTSVIPNNAGGDVANPMTTDLDAGGKNITDLADPVNPQDAATKQFVEDAVTGATPPLTDTHIFVGNSSNVATDVAMSGDATIANTGAITVNKTGGVSFAASATTNALNASNISSGTLAAARGGSGLDGSSAGNGKLLIGNGTGYSLANITSGDSSVTVTDGSGTIALSVSASNIASGTLPIARGGTNNGSLGVSALAVLTGDGSKIVQSATGTASQQLRINAGGTALEFFTPSAGVTSLSGDSSLITNSGSTGAVTLTLGNAAANTVWGNATGSSAAPGYTTNPSVGSITLGTPLTVANGGTGTNTLTDHGVMLGSGTSAVTVTTAGTDGQLLIATTSADPAFTSMSGDAVISKTGAITVSKTGGVAFAASATTDTTNASNISSGTLGDGRLSSNVALKNTDNSFSADQSPSSAGGKNLGSNTTPWGNVFIGGSTGKAASFDTSALTTNRTVTIGNAASTTVQPDAGAANNFLTAISSSGVISRAQPSSSNLSDASNIALRNNSNSWSTGQVPNAAGTIAFGTAALPFSDIFIGGTANKSVHFVTSGLSTDRTLTIANGNSVTVIGDSGAANNFLTAIDPSTGVVSRAQPSSSNLSDSSNIALRNNSNSWSTAQLPNAASTIALGSATLPFSNLFFSSAGASKTASFDTSALTGNQTITIPNAASTTVQANTGAASNFLTAISSSGVVSRAQPSSSDLSDASNVALRNNSNSWSSSQITGTMGSYDIGSTTKAWRSLYITNNGNTTNYAVVTPTTLTGNRAVNIPNADSTTVQPDTGAANNFLTAISAQGVISRAQPSSSNLSDSANVALRNSSNSWSTSQNPSAAGGSNLGTALLPWGNVFIGGAASKSASFDTSALTADRVITVPNSASTTVVADTGASNNFLTAISATGVISKAQPSFSNISGTATIAQGGTGASSFTGRAVVTVNSGGTALSSIAPGSSGNVLRSDGTDWASTTLASTDLSNSSNIALRNNANSWSTAQLPSAAGTIALGSASLPFSNISIGGAASKSASFDTSALTADRSIVVPNAASCTVVADTGAANNFLTAISASGAISRAQPSYSNLSGSGSTNITTLGTITTGTWSATDIAVTDGGTGVSTLTNHGVVLGQGTSAVAVTSAGSSGQALISGGASADPAFGTLPIAGGGTNNASLGVSAVGIIVGDGSKLVQITGSASQQFRVNAGGTAIEAFTPAAAGVTSVTGDSVFITNSGSTGAVTLTLGAIGNPNSDTTSLKFGQGAGAAINSTNKNNTLIGVNAGDSITSGSNNVAVGTNALTATGFTTGTDCTAVGYNALAANTAISNTAVGSGALAANTTSTQNTAVGYLAGNAQVAAGGSCTLIGFQAGDAVTNANCTAVGSNALGTTAGADCTAIGTNALLVCTAANITAVGSGALDANTSGALNTAVGYNAGGANITGNECTFVGYQAGLLCTGSYNTAVGSGALDGQTSGTYNTAVGEEAGGGAGSFSLGTFIGAYAGNANKGSSNTHIGYAAAYSVTTGTSNTFVGCESGYNLPAGASSNNVTLGYRTLYSGATTVSDCTAIGTNALLVCSADQITAVGSGCLDANSSGTQNTGVGYLALSAISTNGSCTAVGFSALDVATGANNTAVGSNAGGAITTGAGGTFIGTNAGLLCTADNTTLIGFGSGDAITSAADCTAVGYNSLGTNQTGGDCTAVGYQAIGTGTGANNTAVGSFACNSIGASTRCTAVGRGALAATGGANDCTAVGYSTLAANIATGTTAVGSTALESCTSGTQNTAVGFNALGDISTAGSCTAVGFSALDVATGARNTALGSNAGGAITTSADSTFIGNDAGLLCTAAQTTLVGSLAGDAITSGTFNTAVGYKALSAVSTNGQNTAVGAQALEGCTGSNNTAIGSLTLTAAMSTNGSTAVGDAALSTTTGQGNTAVGWGAGQNATSGERNVFIGVDAGDTVSTGSRNICIGYNSDTPANNTDDYTNIGGQIVRGAGDITTVNGSTSGTLTWSQPERGSNLKMIIINLNSFNDDGETITFTTAFTAAPAVCGNSTTLTVTSTSTTTCVLPATGGAVSGTIILIGM